jgi:PKD repeat protein
MDDVTSYKWDFGDGGSSTEKTPQYTYKDSGTYNVSLTITTSGGCTETYTLQKAVKVGPRPKAAFTSDVTSACADPGIKFINLSERATEYKWTFSDGTSSTEVSPQHKFNNIGPITVTLTAINNGCEDQVTKNNYATIRPSVSKFDYQPNCNNKLEYTFTDKSIQAQTWEWDFGDGTPKINTSNPGSHTFPGPGEWNVSLTTTNGTCKFTLVRTIKIQDNTPDFNVTSSANCKPAYFTFRSSSPDSLSIEKWVWNYGDGFTDTTIKNLTDHIYLNPGINTVTLTTIDSFGCTDTRSKPIPRVSGPKAGFTSMTNSGCKGMTTTFIDTTVTDGINNIVSWTFDFGDSTRQTYTAPPFSHVYDSIGDYDVKLIVTDAGGCMDSVTLREFVKVSTLKANWEIHSQSCPGSPAWFGNLTTSDFKYTSVWDFGNGETSNERQLWYAFKDTGFFNVKLKVTDEYGCVDSIMKDSAVHIALPKASFDANNLTSYCTPFPLQLTNTSYFAQSSFWDLSQGTSTQTNPTSYYTKTGVYPIKLVVTSAGGCKDSVGAVLRVFSPDDASMTYSPLYGCRPLPVNFEAFTDMNARFIWDFADGNVIDTTINKITHIYDDPGAFQPRIILKQPECPDLALMGKEWVEIVGAKPKFNLPQRLFCDSGYITILDSTVSRDRITNYTWDFGDGTISNSAIPPSHFYSKPGLYNISLAVATESGCKDTLTLKPGVKVKDPIHPQ